MKKMKMNLEGSKLLLNFFFFFQFSFPNRQAFDLKDFLEGIVI